MDTYESLFGAPAAPPAPAPYTAEVSPELRAYYDSVTADKDSRIDLFGRHYSYMPGSDPFSTELSQQEKTLQLFNPSYTGRTQESVDKNLDALKRHYNVLGRSADERDAEYAGLGSIYDSLIGQGRQYGIGWDGVATKGNDAYRVAQALANKGVSSLDNLRYDGSKLVDSSTGKEIALDKGNRIAYSAGGSGDGFTNYRVERGPDGKAVIVPDWHDTGGLGPLGTILPIAASFIPGVGPMIGAALSGMNTLANGGSLADVLKGAALSYAGGALGKFAGGAATNALGLDIGSTLGKTVAGAAGGATRGALGSLVNGNGLDLSSLLSGAVSGGAGAGVSDFVGGDLGKILGRAAGSGLGSLVGGASGQQALRNALMGGLNAGARPALNGLLSSFGPEAPANIEWDPDAVNNTASEGANNMSLSDIWDSFGGGDSGDSWGSDDFSGLLGTLGDQEGDFPMPTTDDPTGNWWEDIWGGGLGGTRGDQEGDFPMPTTPDPTGNWWESIPTPGGSGGGATSGALGRVGDYLSRLLSGDRGATQNANMLLGLLGAYGAYRQNRDGGSGGSRVSPAQLQAMLPGQDSTWSASQEAARQKWLTAPLTQYKAPNPQQFGVNVANPSYARNPAMYGKDERAVGGYAHGGGVSGALGRIRGDVAHMASGGRFVSAGAGGGQDDMVEARLSPGEYVFDADVVAALGDGSNDAGARKLDEMREAIRAHKRDTPAHRIPPKAKSPLQYLKKD